MPKLLPILIHPDPRLREKAAPVTLETINEPDFQALLVDMEETMRQKDGAGLAAPQIGRSLRLALVTAEKRLLVLINPRITKKSWRQETAEEGCLSVLDGKGEIIYAPLARTKRITCVYWDEKGQKQKIRAEKILARIIQHEIDHLDGILFIDRLEKKKTKPL